MVLNTTNGMFDVWSVARSAGFSLFLPRSSWGSAALYPGLYAVAALRGLCIAPLGAALRYFALRHFDHYAALHRPIPEPVKHRIDLLKRLGFNNRLHLSVCGKLQSFLHVFTCAHNRSANREPLQHDVED